MGKRRLGRIAAGLLVCIVCLAAVSSVAVAAAKVTPVKVAPVLGRWEGGTPRVPVVFTVERTASGRRYVVRPVVYCGPDNVVNYETGLFALFQPDAWPIAANGTVRDGPLQGRFADSHSAALRFTGSATCLHRGAVLRPRPAPAVPTVADGSWNVAVAPHARGLIGEVTDFTTRGEGALIESDWDVYDGGTCFIERSAVKLLVGVDGSFTASVNGNGLATNFVTIHLSGRFVSAQTAQGSYSLTGPGCSGTPVPFTATFASAYERPRPSTGGQAPLAPTPPGGTTVNYVALGDSFSSGHGVPPYEPGTDVRAGPRKDICHRSRDAYPQVLRLSGITFARSFFACSGATTDNVTNVVQYPGEGVPQLGHTTSLAQADLVTISVGGDDVHFDQILEQCVGLKGGCSKPTQRARILGLATELEPKLVATYAAIRGAVPPTASVLVLDYPQLFPAGGLPLSCQPDATFWSRPTQMFLRHADDVLRHTIATAARAAGVQFVDVIPTFNRHEICGRDGGWMSHVMLNISRHGVKVNVEVNENSVHPNRAGQAGYAHAIEDYIRARIDAHAPLTPKGLPANPAPQA